MCHRSRLGTFSATNPPLGAPAPQTRHHIKLLVGVVDAELLQEEGKHAVALAEFGGELRGRGTCGREISSSATNVEEAADARAIESPREKR